MKKNYLLLLFLFSSFVYSNPLILGFEAAMSSYFLSSGIDNNEADLFSKEISNKVFNSERSSCRVGRFSSDCSIGEFILDKSSKGNVSFENDLGEVSHLQISKAIDKYSYEDILNKIYLNSDYGDLIFYEKKSFDDVYDYLHSFIDDNYAVAPLWYASTGLFVYRTSKPINRKGEYLYFNDFETLYSSYYLKNELIDFSDKLTELTVLSPDDDHEDGEGFVVDIRREKYELFGFYKDTILKDGFEPPSSISSNFSLKTYLMHSIMDIPKDYIDEWKNIAILDGGSKESYMSAFNYEPSQFTTSLKITDSIDIIKSIKDVNSESDTSYENPPEKVVLIDNYKNVSNEKSLEYKISSDDLLDVYNNLAADYFANYGKTLNTPSGRGSFTVSSDKPLTKSNLSISSDGVVRSISLSSFSSEQTPREAYSSIRGKEVSDDTRNKSSVPLKNQPPSGAEEDINTSGSNITSSGAGTSSSSTSTSNSKPKENINSKVITETNVKTGEKADAAAEDEVLENVPFKDPEIPEVTGLEILEPLIDLKNSLISKLDLAGVSGSCPTFNMDIFGSNITLDIHCKLFQSMAPVISGLALLVYYLIALKIILSS